MSILAQLKPHPDNPRTIEPKKFELLKESIKSAPYMLEKRPVIYDETFTILGGQRRYEALLDLEKEGFEIKDSYFLQATGWTDDQKKEFLIRDNAYQGEWDIEALKANWSMEPLTDWGLDFAEGWKEIDPESTTITNTEIDPDTLLHNGITCPKCGFEFEKPDDV